LIAATSAWIAANAALARQPIYLVKIEGYSRAFATKDGLGSVNIFASSFVVQSANRANIGGIGAPGDVTLSKATPAGNILLAFMNNADGGHTPGISDTAGNTWVPICSDVSTLSPLVTGYVSIWRAVAVASGPGNVVTFTTGNSRVSSDFHVIEVPAAYSSSFFAHTSGAAFTTYAGAPTATTSDGNTLTIPLAGNGTAQDLFMVSLSTGSGPNAGLAIGMLSHSTGGNGDPANVISVAGGSGVVGGSTATSYDWLTDIGDISLTVSDLDGGANLSNLTFSIQDNGHSFTSDLALFVFEGRKIELLEGFVGLALTDYLVRFTGRVGTVASSNGNAEYAFDCPDVRADLAKVIYTVGDDGFPTDSSHPKTLLGNPLDILLDILRNQVGYNDAQIDVATIQNYRDTIFSGITFEFSLTSPPAAKDFIENEILKPLGGYHWPNNLGVFKIHFFYPLAPASVATLDHDVLEDVPLAEEAALVNQVAWRFDQGAGSSTFLAESVESYGASISKYGLYEENVIESAGMRSGFQGYFMAAFVSRLIFLRYGSKQLQVENIPLRWIQSLLEPGDFVSVTSSLVPDRKAGTIGVTAKTFEVLDRSWSFMPQIASVKLLEADLSKFKQYLITPNAEADFAADTSLNKAKYLYLSDATGKYSTGVTANTVC
jgi:hypothetical protein